MAYIPTADDIQPVELATIATGGDISPIAERLDLTVQQLQRYLSHDELMVEMISSTVAELEMLSKIRLAVLMPQALNTLESVMQGRVPDKQAMSRVKAAETVLDRTLPKKGRDGQPSNVKGPGTLPSIPDLLEKAKSPEEALALMEEQQKLIARADALRDKARGIEIIDVDPEVVEK
jgi:hypothetical protein